MISIASRFDKKILDEEGDAILQAILEYNKALSFLSVKDDE